MINFCLDRYSRERRGIKTNGKETVLYQFRIQKVILANNDFCVQYFLFVTFFCRVLDIAALGHPEKTDSRYLLFSFLDYAILLFLPTIAIPFSFLSFFLLSSFAPSSSAVLLMLPLITSKVLRAGAMICWGKNAYPILHPQ